MTLAALLLALLPAAQLVAAYGRFPCYIINGDGTKSADPSQCLDNNLVNPGGADGASGLKGDQPTPVSPVCTLAPETGDYYCGIAGAACATDSNCDNGYCSDGVCQGGLAKPCFGSNSICSGYLYCLTPGGRIPPTGTCGANGAQCTDTWLAPDWADDEVRHSRFDQLCQSGYCDLASGACAANPNAPPVPTPVFGSVGENGDCSTDDRVCADGFKCTHYYSFGLPVAECLPIPASTTTTTTTPGPTTTAAASSTSRTTITLAPPTSSGFFTVSGVATTSKPLSSSVSVWCARSQAFQGCIDGADRRGDCCVARGGDFDTCQDEIGANYRNCNSVGIKYYPCESEDATEECCSRIFEAYFGGGGDGGEGGEGSC
ncbi:hypothetical protein JCM10450v2_003904 [Rhodotorula kratochvilovae]